MLSVRNPTGFHAPIHIHDTLDTRHARYTTRNYPRCWLFIMASLSDARVPSRACQRHPSSTHHRDGMMTRYARTVWAIETGGRPVRLREAVAIADALGVDVDYFTGDAP